MSTSQNKPSLLLLEECLAAADDRFIAEFQKVSSAKVLQDYLQKLSADPRPWARQVLLRFVSSESQTTGHQYFFKRLFKLAEANRDHELMTAFLVSLDRLVRRSRIVRSWWNRELRVTVHNEFLYAAPNAVPLEGEWKPRRPKRALRLFSQQTRAYLRRRVWRYFRWMSYREPQLYVTLISKALCEYKDSDFESGENIIDNWSLMHACYFHSDVVMFTGSHCNLKPGQSLTSLSAAPYRPENWKTDEAFDHLVQVASDSQSSLVRVWALELLQREHSERLGRVEFSRIERFLASDDQRIQQFALEIVRNHPELPRLTVSTWLGLLKSVHPLLLSQVCSLMKTHVALSRISNDQIIQLANAAATPVAELGYQFVTQRHTERAMTVSEIVSLSQTQCEAIGGKLATWGLAQLATAQLYSADCVVEFFDSTCESVRSAAMDWLESGESPGYNDSLLWSRLVETPFDNVRLRLIQCLQHRVHRNSDSSVTLQADSLSPIWCTVLLGVHRGGREKLHAMEQIRFMILKNPKSAESLLPVLSVAARSIRPPERRRALATLASLVEQVPALSESIRHHIPELVWAETLTQ